MRRTSPKGAKLGRVTLLPSFRPTRGEIPACRSISTKRRTSPKGAKSAKRGIPSQGMGYNKRGDPSHAPWLGSG